MRPCQNSVVVDKAIRPLIMDDLTFVIIRPFVTTFDTNASI